MRIWVHWPGMRRFLGDVAPGETAVIDVPGDLVQRFETLQLRAQPSGSAEYMTTSPLDVRTDGHHIEWRLRRVLANSRARII